MNTVLINIALILLVIASGLMGYTIANYKNKKRIEYLEATLACLWEINSLLQKKNKEINYKNDKKIKTKSYNKYVRWTH